MNNSKRGFLNLFNLDSLLLINLFFAILAHIFLLNTVKYNSMMSDDTRIIGNFFVKYIQSVSIEDKIKSLFEQENEGYPGLIRLFYLLTYKLTGSTQFNFIGYLGNLFILQLLYIQYKILQYFAIPKHIYLSIPWILINTHAFFTFFYSFESIFYISSVILPIVLFYYFFLKNNTKIALILLFILSLYTSVYLIVGAILIAGNLLKKEWKLAILFAFLTGFIYWCLNSFLKTDDGITRGSLFYIKTLENFGTILYLFFIHLGTWGFIFKLSPLICSFAGFISFVITIFILIDFFRQSEVKKAFLFFSSTFTFLWLLIIVNIIFRWEFDASYFIPFLEAGHKAFFSLVYLTFFLIIFIYKWHIKKPTYIVWCMFILIYFLGLYFKYPNYLEVYKRRMLYSLNKTTRNANYAPFKATRHFEKLGLLKNDLTWIEKQKNELIRGINSDVKMDTSLQLKQFIPTDLPNNMYGKPVRFPVILFTFDLEFEGDPLNHNDGLYYVFVSKNDTAVYPSQFKPNSIRKFLLGKSIFSNWNICTIENVHTEELTENQYAIYYFSSRSGIINSICKTNYILSKSTTGYFLRN